MGGLTLRGTNLDNLRNKVRALTSNAVSLANLFAEEADRLSRMHMESQLRALRASIMQQLHMAKAAEDAARCSYIQTDTKISLDRLAVGGVIKMVPQDNKLLSAIGDQLLRKPAGKQRPFGMVLVCIGPTGVPDGVQIVSVSQLARESKREEAAVTSALWEHGHLLFSESNFSLLIDKLIEGVQEGRLALPVSAEKLPTIKLIACRRLEYKRAE